jgi:hypothetical protein
MGAVSVAFKGSQLPGRMEVWSALVFEINRRKKFSSLLINQIYCFYSADVTSGFVVKSGASSLGHSYWVFDIMTKFALIFNSYLIHNFVFP